MTDSTDDSRRPYQEPSITPTTRRGQPTKYCFRRHDAFCKAVEEGLSRECAAAMAGVSLSAVYEWMREYPEFMRDVKKADADFENRIIQNIQAASYNEKTWQAGAWLLERKNPRRWGRFTEPHPDPVDKDDKDQTILKTRLASGHYLLVPVDGTDVVSAYHDSRKASDDLPSTEPVKPE